MLGRRGGLFSSTGTARAGGIGAEGRRAGRAWGVSGSAMVLAHGTRSPCPQSQKIIVPA